MAKKRERENTINKDIFITRIIKTIPEEPKLVKKIMAQIKNSRKKPRFHLNINEKQLQVHLAEVIKKWEKSQVSSLIDKFLSELKSSWQRGENVSLVGIFSSRVYRAASRKSRNPQTGRPILVPPKNRLKFRVSSKLKRILNNKLV
ncbi:MAG: histone-like DNA-binding protein [Mycoplasmataceae bacterium RC_NB112A]|nr:MAG: histone-like DNA-binding protein [Mycoplasmataceae bacterium RC_NB112A]